MIPNALFIPKANEFLAHWGECNAVLPPADPLKVQWPDKDTLKVRTDLETMRNNLQSQVGVVQSRLGTLQLVRGSILAQKTTLLGQFNEFNACMDASFLNTLTYLLRPNAPNLTDGQVVFSNALWDMIVCWDEVNLAPAPAGIQLPLLLSGGVSRDTFASAISALQFTYADEKSKDGKVTLALGTRDNTHTDMYGLMKAYRKSVAVKMRAFPLLVETLPRLTPLPGHTPDAVNASAIFVAPDQSKIVYDVSNDSDLYVYQLRGHVGDHWSDDLAEVLMTNQPGAPREFITPFGLNQPGAQVVFKVYVVLNTGNEAGSTAMSVQRPLSQAA